jgi:ketosteroid isomerase-like protein
MKKLFLIVLIVSSIGAFAQNSKEEDVWKRSEALNNAIFVKKDSLALVDLVTKEVTYGHSTGAVEDKATMIKNAIGNRGGYKNIEFERITINVDDKTAVLRHNLRGVSLNGAGQESPLNLQILQVWKKDNGKWRIWARQAVKIPAKG